MGAIVCAAISFLPDLATGRWILAAVAATLVGIAKTGVPGFGTLAVPLMVLAVGDARYAAGWLLPLLCVADVFAVAIYRRKAYARRLVVLFPWVLVGMGAGAIALAGPERVLRPVVAVIVIGMIAFRWLRARREPSPPSEAAATATATGQAAVYGGAAGFATTIANAAGPVMSLYLLAKRLPKDEFVGTGVWFFLIVNLCKLPIYTAHGLVNARSLAFDVVLIPAVVAGAGLGRVLLGRLAQRTFERLVLALTIVAAGMLLIPK
ncbi:MAG: sulfite exporter TauE/SafE family protein [Bacteroidota bacterium]